MKMNRRSAAQQTSQTAKDLLALPLSDIMVNEDMTNAVWNKILHDIFKAPDFLISPEYYFDGKHRADLAVIVTNVDREDQKHLLNKPLVVFEGKKKGGDKGVYTLGKALGQAKACSIAKGPQSGCVAIASLGIAFRITVVNDAASHPTFTGNLGGEQQTYDVSQNLDRIVDYLTATARNKSRPVPGSW